MADEQRHTKMREITIFQQWNVQFFFSFEIGSAQILMVFVLLALLTYYNIRSAPNGRDDIVSMWKENIHAYVYVSDACNTKTHFKLKTQQWTCELVYELGNARKQNQNQICFDQ